MCKVDHDVSKGLGTEGLAPLLAATGLVMVGIRMIVLNPSAVVIVEGLALLLVALLG